MNVSVFNSQDDLEIDSSSVRSVVEKVLSLEAVHTDHLEVSFVSKEEICSLHSRFFQDSSPTDCITLPMDQEEGASPHVLGEIFVCPAVALARISHKHSSRFGQTVLSDDKESPAGRVKLTLPRVNLKSDGETGGQSGRTVCEKCGLKRVESKQAYRETTLYLVHSLLHLLGYDDLEPIEQKVMRAKEEEYLQLLSREKLLLTDKVLACSSDKPSDSLHSLQLHHVENQPVTTEERFIQRNCVKSGLAKKDFASYSHIKSKSSCSRVEC